VVFDDDNLYLIGPDRTYHDGSTVWTDVTYTRNPEGGYVARGVPHLVDEDAPPQ
jgi:hypothetical protein